MMETEAAENTLMEFLGKSKTKDFADLNFKPTTQAIAAKSRRMINKQTAAAIIGPYEAKKKQMVILSSKDIA